MTDAECFQAQPDLGHSFSNRTFCAGGKGVGPCLGDSGEHFLVLRMDLFMCSIAGGGMFAYFKKRWTLKGIISATVATAIEDCDVEKYSLFTRVSNFIGWIEAVVFA